MTIKLVGTTHLDSKESIIKIIEEEKPDMLVGELCDLRVNVILNEKEAKPNEDKSLLGKITDKLKSKSEKEGLDYGSDQKSVLRYAKNNNTPYFPVDMPILKIQELFNLLPQNEQQGFQKELSEFENQPLIEQQDEEQVIQTLKSRYPIAFEFLINMRNLYIANQILKLEKKYPNEKILVFLGKSHIKQIEVMLQ